jgi:ubiquinone/menaquinone biosynthesis C-methylase UbiE
MKPRCTNYTFSQYFPDVDPGKIHKGVRCENLSQLTFPDASFDLFITQDVFEHVFEAEKAFNEIQRVLKPGGAHIFTMPWYPHLDNTILRAEIIDGQLVHHHPAVYHKNPVDDTGSLVVRDWGKDFAGFVRRCSGMETMTYLHKERRLGLDAEFLEVFISHKNPVK